MQNQDQNGGVSNRGVNNRGVANENVSNGGVNSRGVINRSDKKMLQMLLISCKLEMKLVFKLHPLHSIRNYSLLET